MRGRGGLGVAEHVGSEEGVAREQEAGEGVAPASGPLPSPFISSCV